MTAPDHENMNTSGEAMPRQPQPVKDDLVETTHQVTINGERLQYTVTCGTMVLKEEAVKNHSGGESEGEKPKASIFFIAYTRQDVPDLSARPVTFSFNGGPGSSSVWLHLGVLGPRRVLMDDMGNTLPPPYRLVENEYSLLDKTDLVFIDPVSTGYSRVVSGEKVNEFHGFKRDIESVGDFIRLYTTRYHRWASPKFLIGESYGTTRAAGLAGYLQDRHGLYLNGLMLISSVLHFSTLEFDLGNDLPYILFLPTYTATAWYHRRLPEELQSRTLSQVLEEVEAFALGDYALGLMRGAALPEEERSRLVERLARYTGLSPEYVRRAGLRLEIFRFVKELLREEQQTVGRLDSRFRGYDRDAAGEHPEFDPSLTNITGPYTAMLNHYVRAELNFESDLPYEILNPKVWPWSYSEHENRYVEVAETLRKAMTVNPFLKVFVGSGFFDLATPYFATVYTLNHLALAENLAENITTSFYEAGHMMYIEKASLVKLKEDLARFIEHASV
jgi:carboxypeptidase C (cathepsin A)